MREVGIDVDDHVPRRLDDEALEWADLAVSTCGDEVCPVTPGVRRMNWDLPDPGNMPLDQVRQVRDDIENRVEQLVAELDRETTAA